MTVPYPFFIGEVRDIKDPRYSGRVKIRIYGLHDDEQKVKDDQLPWALPLMPATSASTAKVGVAPVGMLKGSRVFGFWSDEYSQYPVIIGTFYRSDQPKDRKDNTHGEEGLKSDQIGSDVPSSANPKPQGGRENTGRAPHNSQVGGAPLNTENDRYNYAQYKDNGDGPNGVEAARKKFAPNADKKTIAGQPPGLDLPAAVAASGAKDVLPQMMQLLALINALMAANSGSNNGAPSSTIQKQITPALAGALRILSAKYGFQYVIDIFNHLLENNGIILIEEEFRGIVKEALAVLLQTVLDLGGEKKLIYIDTTPTVIKMQIGGRVPLPIYGFAPLGYVKVSYLEGENPYPGYATYVGPNEDRIYLVDDVITDIATEEEKRLARDLEPYIRDNNLTATVLNTILARYTRYIADRNFNKVFGENAANMIMSMLPMLLGLLGTAINRQQSEQLPLSVLNAGSITASLTAYAKNMAIMKRMKTTSSSAFDTAAGLAGAAGVFGGLLGGASIASAVGGIVNGVAQGNIAGAVVSVASAATTISNSYRSSGSNASTARSVANLVTRIV